MKTIIVTGGTRGIGKAIVNLLVDKIQQQDPQLQHAQLVVTYRSGAESAKALQQQCAERGVMVDMQVMDLADQQSMQQFSQYMAERYGRIDVLVNNAGLTHDGAFLALADHDVAALLHTNLAGTIQLTELLLPLIPRQQQAAIVVMASAAGVYGKEGQVPYSTTKGGLIGYAQLLARRVGRDGIYVNAVAPGFIATDMVAALDPAMFEHTLSNASLGAMGQTRDVAHIVHSLFTPGYIQATTIKVDGGHLR
jgi:3-oxoacyl-[acyl-carrier protein] reductase